ncbi:hypothetical protein ES703_49055 [subsurface metagenome]
MVYDLEFKPILQRSHTVTLFGPDFPAEGANYKCLAVDALPEYINDFGALTAGTWKADQEDTNLELTTYELGQLRMMVLDDVKVRLKNPAPTQKWRTNKTNFYLPLFPTEAGQDWYKQYLFALSELFYWQKVTPRFDLYSTIALDAARVLFTGWKFKLTPVTEKGAFELLVSGWPASAGK